MIIKKYQAKTEAEAVEQAKKELGQNVVIMNVRDAKKKGFFRFFKPKQVEITVALEEEAERMPAKKEDTALKSGGILPKELVQSTMDVTQKPAEKKEVSLADRAIEEKLDSLQSLLEKQLKPAEEEPAVTAAEEETSEKNETAEFIRLLYNTMIDNEVNEKYANQIIDEFEKNNKSNTPMDYALANVYQKMILKFGKAMEIQPAEKGPKVVFFVGPTGVGKTTTIAKIASKYRLEAKKKIALLTADTYRIAAAEQLHTYANILEVPFRIVYTPEEIVEALHDLAEFDYIFVDTAGHSHNNEAQKDTMKQFVYSVDELAEKEVFLVLSATTKYKDLLHIADAYSSMTEYKLIFTKLDETTTVGNLLNLKLYTGAPMSYVTCGQNVPDDIEVFNPQKTVKQLLGGKN